MNRKVFLALAGLGGLLLAAAPHFVHSQPTAQTPPADRQPDVIFVPTPQEAVDKMLEMAQVKKGDLVYDLGCGDGRIVVTAARKYGVTAVGVDIDPQRVKESRENVKKNGVEDLVTIVHGDIFELDLSEVDVVTLYLLPDLNVKLMPQLRKMKPGSRIVSYEFAMRGAKPAEVHHGDHKDRSYGYTIYKWVVPWEEE
jgi:ubiquinone/menaquinone biosynthesis C-methylase UbiE